MTMNLGLNNLWADYAIREVFSNWPSTRSTDSLRMINHIKLFTNELLAVNPDRLSLPLSHSLRERLFEIRQTADILSMHYDHNYLDVGWFDSYHAYKQKYDEAIDPIKDALKSRLTDISPNNSDFLLRRDLSAFSCWDIPNCDRLGWYQAIRSNLSHNVFINDKLDSSTFRLPLVFDFFKNIVDTSFLSIPLRDVKVKRNELLNFMEYMTFSNLLIEDRSYILDQVYYDSDFLELRQGGAKSSVWTGGSDRFSDSNLDREYRAMNVIFNDLLFGLWIDIESRHGFCNSIFHDSKFDLIRYGGVSSSILEDHIASQTTRQDMSGLFVDCDIINTSAKVEIAPSWHYVPEVMQVSRRSLYLNSDIEIGHTNHIELGMTVRHDYKGDPLTLLFRDCIFKDSNIHVKSGIEKDLKILYENCIWL